MTTASRPRRPPKHSSYGPPINRSRALRSAGISGNTGAFRSSAWICDFASGDDIARYEPSPLFRRRKRERLGQCDVQDAADGAGVVGEVPERVEQCLVAQTEVIVVRDRHDTRVHHCDPVDLVGHAVESDESRPRSGSEGIVAGLQSHEER